MAKNVGHKHLLLRFLYYPYKLPAVLLTDSYWLFTENVLTCSKTILEYGKVR